MVICVGMEVVVVGCSVGGGCGGKSTFTRGGSGGKSTHAVATGASTKLCSSAARSASASSLVAFQLPLADRKSHCITKMNTCMGFSAHIPGMGRQPLGAGEQERHVKQLGAALVAAIGRDFAAPHRSIASLPITANLVTELAQAHLRACVLYQNELSNALARANMEGEEARRQERMRIWGYSS